MQLLLQITLYITATILEEQMDSLKQKVKLRHENNKALDVENSKSIHILLDFNSTNKKCHTIIGKLIQDLNFFLENKLYVNKIKSKKRISSPKAIVYAFYELITMHQRNAMGKDIEKKIYMFAGKKQRKVYKYSFNQDYDTKNNQNLFLYKKKCSQFYFLCNYFNNKRSFQFLNTFIAKRLIDNTRNKNLKTIIISCKFPSKTIKENFLESFMYEEIHNVCTSFILFNLDNLTNNNTVINKQEQEKFQLFGQYENLYKRIPSCFGLVKNEECEFNYTDVFFQITIYKCFTFDSCNPPFLQNETKCYKLFKIKIRVCNSVFLITINYVNETYVINRETCKYKYIIIKTHDSCGECVFLKKYFFETNYITNDSKENIDIFEKNELVLTKKSSIEMVEFFNYFTLMNTNQYYWHNFNHVYLPILDCEDLNYESNPYYKKIFIKCKFDRINSLVKTYYNEKIQKLKDLQIMKLDYYFDDFTNEEKLSNFKEFMFYCKHINIKPLNKTEYPDFFSFNNCKKIIAMCKCVKNNFNNTIFISFNFWFNFLKLFKIFYINTIKDYNRLKNLIGLKDLAPNNENQYILHYLNRCNIGIHNKSDEYTKFVITHLKQCNHYKIIISLMFSQLYLERYINLVFRLYEIYHSNDFKHIKDYEEQYDYKNGAFYGIFNEKFLSITTIECHLEANNNDAKLPMHNSEKFVSVLGTIKKFIDYLCNDFNLKIKLNGMNICFELFTEKSCESSEEFENYVGQLFV